MLRKLLLALPLLLLSNLAAAGRQPLDPQNRVHAGLSVADGDKLSDSSFGLALGLDSRMTRLVSLDVGGFLSPLAVSGEAPAAGEEAIFLRHGVYVAPGFRIPHKSSKSGWGWDVVFRVGFAGVWWTDLGEQSAIGTSSTARVGLDPAALGGLDLQLRKNAFGVRLGGKDYVFAPFSNSTLTSTVLNRPQGAVEAFYQW